jgi:hypothetical protein
VHKGLFLSGKPERNRPLAKLRSRWDNNIKMDLREISVDGA